MDGLGHVTAGDPRPTIWLPFRSCKGGPPDAKRLSGLNSLLPPLNSLRIEQIAFSF